MIEKFDWIIEYKSTTYSVNKSKIKSVMKDYGLKWKGGSKDSEGHFIGVWSSKDSKVYAVFQGHGKPATFYIKGDFDFMNDMMDLADEIGADYYDFEESKESEITEDDLPFTLKDSYLDWKIDKHRQDVYQYMIEHGKSVEEANRLSNLFSWNYRQVLSKKFEEQKEYHIQLKKEVHMV